MADMSMKMEFVMDCNSVTAGSSDTVTVPYRAEVKYDLFETETINGMI